MIKLFVGGLDYAVTDKQLEELFAKFGTVQSAKIITDNYSGNSKGFAFVEMSNEDDAQKAIKELDGFGLEGRKIGVSVARPKTDSPSRDNFRSNDNYNSRKSGGNNFLKGSNRR